MKNRFLMAAALVAGLFAFAGSANAFTLGGGCGCDAAPSCCEPVSCCRPKRCHNLFNRCCKPKCCETSCCNAAPSCGCDAAPTCAAPAAPTCGMEAPSCGCDAAPSCGCDNDCGCRKHRCCRQPRCCRPKRCHNLFNRCCGGGCDSGCGGCAVAAPSCGCGA